MDNKTNGAAIALLFSHCQTEDDFKAAMRGVIDDHRLHGLLWHAMLSVYNSK